MPDNKTEEILRKAKSLAIKKTKSKDLTYVYIEGVIPIHDPQIDYEQIEQIKEEIRCIGAAESYVFTTTEKLL